MTLKAMVRKNRSDVAIEFNLGSEGVFDSEDQTKYSKTALYRKRHVAHGRAIALSRRRQLRFVFSIGKSHLAAYSKPMLSKFLGVIVTLEASRFST